MNKNSNTFTLHLPSNMIWPRIFAIILVFLGHSELHIGGGYGAVFFLTLSAYIFTRLMLQEQTEGLKLSFAKFITYRLVKVFPPLIVLVLLSILSTIALHRTVDFVQVISIFTFVTNYYNSYFGHPNNGLAHLWSLSVTIQYSVFYFILINTIKSKKNINIILIGLSILCLSYRSLLVSMNWGSDAYIYNSLETRGDALLMGSLLAMNIESIYEHKSWAWPKHPATFFFNLWAIYYVGQFTPFWRNGLGFTIHAILNCLLIYQILSYKVFIIPMSTYKKLSLLCFWFYFFHPWAFVIGHLLPLAPIWQVIMGAILLIIIMLLFIFLRDEISKEFKTRKSTYLTAQLWSKIKSKTF